MAVRLTSRTVRHAGLIATTLLATAGLWLGVLVNQLPAAVAPATRAVITGSVDSGVHFKGSIRRTSATRWCGHLEVGVRPPQDAGAVVEEIYDSGRECGTIERESVVMLTLACPTALGVGGVLRGRPTLRVEYADGRVRAVRVRRIRDRLAGTFFAIALTAAQLPATVRIVGGPTIADVPAVGEVC